MKTITECVAAAGCLVTAGALLWSTYRSMGGSIRLAVLQRYAGGSAAVWLLDTPVVLIPVQVWTLATRQLLELQRPSVLVPVGVAGLAAAGVATAELLRGERAHPYLLGCAAMLVLPLLEHAQAAVCVGAGMLLLMQSYEVELWRAAIALTTAEASPTGDKQAPDGRIEPETLFLASIMYSPALVSVGTLLLGPPVDPHPNMVRLLVGILLLAVGGLQLGLACIGGRWASGKTGCLVWPPLLLPGLSWAQRRLAYWTLTRRREQP